MPWITSTLLVIICLLQYSLWLGKRSFPKLQETDKTLLTQKQKNTELKLRNTAMEAEIQDLKRGLDAIEEHARSELGMVKPKEILYQYLTPPTQETNMIVVSSQPQKQEVIQKIKKSTIKTEKSDKTTNVSPEDSKTTSNAPHKERGDQIKMPHPVISNETKIENKEEHSSKNMDE